MKILILILTINMFNVKMFLVYIVPVKGLHKYSTLNTGLYT